VAGLPHRLFTSSRCRTRKLYHCASGDCCRSQTRDIINWSFGYHRRHLGWIYYDIEPPLRGARVASLWGRHSREPYTTNLARHCVHTSPQQSHRLRVVCTRHHHSQYRHFFAYDHRSDGLALDLLDHGMSGFHGLGVDDLLRPRDTLAPDNARAEYACTQYVSFFAMLTAPTQMVTRSPLSRQARTGQP